MNPTDPRTEHPTPAAPPAVEEDRTETAAHASCDVLVVGAGPAGIAAAREAARGGVRVVVVESAGLPRRKSCGGMLNEYAQRFLAGVAELPSGLALEPEWVHFRYYDWDRRIKKPCSLRFRNVDRALFDEWLLNLLPAGVEVWDRCSFSSCTQDQDGLSVRLTRAGAAVELRCRWLVGADGARSAVRRAHPAWPQTQCYKTVQEFVEIEPGSLEPFFDCVYSRRIAPAYGYGYIVPKGDVAIVGSVFFPGTKDIPPMHERALETFRERYPLGASVRREAGVAIQVRSLDDVVAGSGRILMAGEAAGLMSPSSGEGISFALNSGRLAGDAVAQAHAAGDRGDACAALATYERSLVPMRKNIARRLRFFPVMNSSWGKWLGGCMPTPLVSKVTEWL